MKTRTLLLLFCYIFTSNFQIDANTRPLSDIIIDEHGLTPNQFCNYVYRRYYFVKRLTSTMLLFLDVEDRITKQRYKKTEIDTLFSFPQNQPFKDVRIKKSIDIMQQQRSLKPLFMIWDDFATYKSIKDQLFIEEFTKEVFIISRNMLHNMYQFNELDWGPTLRSDMSLEEMLNAITHMTNIMFGISNTFNENTFDIDNKKIVDLQTFAHIDDITKRYYLLKRMQQAIALLTILEDHQLIMKDKRAQHQWQHPYIHSCVHVMQQAQSIEPLIDLWRDLEQYKYVHDELFMQEFAQLVLLTFSDVVSYCQAQHMPIKRDVVNAALQAYSMINSLPLEDVLDAIDLITQELPKLLEKYEFSSDLSWRDWFKKYWWAPPLIITTIIVKILLNRELKEALSLPASDPALSTPTTLVQQTPAEHLHEGDTSWHVVEPGECI